MSTIKTLENNGSVTDFIESIEDEIKKKDSYTLLALFERITGESAKMWGTSMIGFGKYHYKSERSRQEGDWPLTAYSPRKQNLTIYVMPGFDSYTDLLQKLGKHTISKGCLYLKKLSDIDTTTLEKLITISYEDMKKRYTS